MWVIEAAAMGMCFGVRDALAAMRRIERPAEMTVFGQLVHNPEVTRELRGRGFQMLEEAGRAATDVRTAAVVITAHGVSDRERLQLMEEGREVVDTTCPLVRKAHAAAVGLSRLGYFVVVIGRKGHVEVRGLTGDLPEGGYEIVETQMGVRCYGGAVGAGGAAVRRIGVVAQTTSVEREARGIVARIRELNPPPSEVRFVNTICQPTRDRLAALERLLEQVDVLVAVGGRVSNNTRQLAARGREAGIRTVHVEGPEELEEVMFVPWEMVGLTAGTSTLAETVVAVKRKLEGFHATADLSARESIGRRVA